MDQNKALEAVQIEQRLQGAAKEAHVAVFPSLASTNATAKQMAAEGAQNGSVVIAEHQSAGRGRMSRSFFSPDGTGLYMSVIVRRSLPAVYSTRLTTAAAVATAQAIERISGRSAQIKWVNDIYLDGKKVCGILTEGGISPDTGMLEYAVVGIGVNIAPPCGDFPADLAEIATSLFKKGQAPNDVRECLAAGILNQLMVLLDDLDNPDILDDYRRRCLVLGKQVCVHRGDADARHALALDVDHDFRLVVRYEDGSNEALDSGEVSAKI
ncbi:MAG: biotin--[Clostridia bacterium]|nr:biotin--[acetyl-CoA-carboxylase] ligase [Clostridia bacterium]